jgi:hypothetical protein
MTIYRDKSPIPSDAHHPPYLEILKGFLQMFPFLFVAFLNAKRFEAALT